MSDYNFGLYLNKWSISQQQFVDDFRYCRKEGRK